jgi:hypothetical protein
MDDVDALIAERKKTHGDFREKSELAQATKAIWRSAPNWSKLSAVQKEGLEYVIDKITRALAGDPNFKDHWMDTMGYIRRILEDIDRGG